MRILFKFASTLFVMASCFQCLNSEEQKTVSCPEKFRDPLPDQAQMRLGTTRFRHVSAIGYVGFIAEKNMVIGGSLDAGPGVWCISTGESINTPRYPKFDASCFSISPNSSILALGERNGSIVLWNCLLGNEILKIKVHKKYISSLAFSPNGKLLASTSLDDTARIWDVSSGSEIAKWTVKTHGICTLSFSPNSTLLAVGNEEGNVHIWSIATQKALCALTATSTAVTGVAFPNDKSVLTHDIEGELRCWSIPACKEKISYKDSRPGLCNVAVSPDGSTLATSHKDGGIGIWNITTGNLVNRFSVSKVDPVFIAFSQCGKYVAAAIGNAIQVWVLKTGTNIIESDYGPFAKVNSIFLSLTNS